MAFMIPLAQEWSASEAWEYVQASDWYEEGLHHPEDYGGGWYACLTAPGYMDRTDFTGPFPRAWMALRAVCRDYDVRLDGEDRFDPEAAR